jgi:restriction system protein
VAGSRKSNDAVKLAGILTLVVILFTLLVWVTRRDLTLTIIFFISLFATIVFITVYLIKRERRNLLASGIDAVDKMGSRHFAYFLEVLFKRQGFTVKETLVVGNYGADLILERSGNRLVAQARRWKNNAGIKVVDDAVAAVKHHHAHNGIIISNTYFTDEAIGLARSNGIELWDRDKLMDLLSGK